MAFFKAKVLRQRKDGMYVVYIRVTQNRKSKYIRTSWVVGDDGLSRDKLDIITPFVAEQITMFATRNRSLWLNQTQVNVSTGAVCPLGDAFPRVFFIELGCRFI